MGFHRRGRRSRWLFSSSTGQGSVEIESVEEAQQVLEGWARDDGSIPGYLCLVELSSRHGALLGTDTAAKIRPLQ